MDGGWAGGEAGLAVGELRCDDVSLSVCVYMPGSVVCWLMG